MEVFIWFCKKS